MDTFNSNSKFSSTPTLKRTSPPSVSSNQSTSEKDTDHFKTPPIKHLNKKTRVTDKHITKKIPLDEIETSMLNAKVHIRSDVSATFPMDFDQASEFMTRIYSAKADKHIKIAKEYSCNLTSIIIMLESIRQHCSSSIKKKSPI